MFKRSLLALTVITTLFITGMATADIPRIMNFQGYLADGDNLPPDSTYEMLFSIWTESTGGDSLWGETVSDSVHNGLYSVTLGINNPIIIDTNQALWLKVTIGEWEMNGRYRLAAVPYALSAIYADSCRTLVDTADVNFGGTVTFGNSTMRVIPGANGGVQIGSFHAGPEGELLLIKQHFNTSTIKTGIELELEQDGDGSIHGFDMTLDQSGTGEMKGMDMSLYPDNSSQVRGINLDIYHSGTESANMKGIRVDVDGGPNSTSIGIQAEANYGNSATGVDAYASNVNGNAYGIYTNASGAGNNAIGIYARASSGGNETWAGYFSGDVKVTGDIYSIDGGFEIDHPLNPSSKYLKHSTVSAPERINVYNGNAMLDASGQAIIELPAYFEELNRDFRYQLTCVGGYAPIYISHEVSGNRFTIAGGEPNMKVSWQVTGIRKDKWAEAHPLQVEPEKEGDERGRYLHPELYGFGIERHVDYDLVKDRDENRDRK